MGKKEWQERLVGTWQISGDDGAMESGPCYTFTPEGRFSIKILSRSFMQDALLTAGGDGSSGRWRVAEAADQVVLHMWTLKIERGLGELLDPPWLKPALFLFGRLHPPEEWLLVSAEEDVIKLRRRPAYRGRVELPLQMVRRPTPL